MASRVPGSSSRAFRPGVRTSNLRRRGRREGGWASLGTRIKNDINLAARQAAAAIMNDLAEKGPAYSGEFRDNWRARAVTGGINSPQPSGYPYSTKDVPQLDTKYKTMELMTIFSIENDAPYALQAMDIEPGRWMRPKGVEPEGGVEFGLQYGTRDWRGDREMFRWDIDAGPDTKDTSVITAERDWYTTYVRDGSMSAEFKRVVRLAFRRSR